MSKSWRDGDDRWEDGERKHRTKKRDRKYLEDGSINYERRIEQPENLTLEWTIDKMMPYITKLVRRLVSEGLITEHQTEDYLSELKVEVCMKFDDYDPARVDDEGRTSGILNYMHNVVHNRYWKLVRYIKLPERQSERVPVDPMSVGEAMELGFVSEESTVFSDGCRTIQEVDFKLDLNTLARVLSKRELVVLNFRLMGYSTYEIADVLGATEVNGIGGLSKDQVFRSLKRIRHKARLLGFEPPVKRPLMAIKAVEDNSSTPTAV